MPATRPRSASRTPGSGRAAKHRRLSIKAFPNTRRLPVATLADALEFVRLNCLRWRIEEVFRVLKSDGLEPEEIEAATAISVTSSVH
jgi:Transposase DDE domain